MGTMISVAHRTRGGSRQVVPVATLRELLAAAKLRRQAAAQPRLEPPGGTPHAGSGGEQEWQSCCTSEAMSDNEPAEENVPPGNVYSPTELATSQWKDADALDAPGCTVLCSLPRCASADAPAEIVAPREGLPASAEVEPLSTGLPDDRGAGEAHMEACQMVKRSVRKKAERCRLCAADLVIGKTVRCCKVCATYACCSCWTAHQRADRALTCTGRACPERARGPPLLAITGLVAAATEAVDPPVQRDLAEACMATPAPTTLLYVPRQTETRVAALLVRAAHAVVMAHSENGPDSLETWDAWRLLWLAPTLLLRVPDGSKVPAGDASEGNALCAPVAQALRLRCQRAECWDWGC